MVGSPGKLFLAARTWYDKFSFESNGNVIVLEATHLASYSPTRSLQEKTGGKSQEEFPRNGFTYFFEVNDNIGKLNVFKLEFAYFSALTALCSSIFNESIKLRQETNHILFMKASPM